MVRNFDAGIHRKTTLQIQSSNAKTTTTCTIPMRTQDVWKIGARTNRNQQFTASRTRGNYPRRKSSRKHTILCTLGRQHPPRCTNTLASEQAHATEKIIKTMKHMLDYLATNPNATVRFYPSDMILNVHSDASYLSAKNAKSRAAGHFFLVWQPDDKRPICLGGPILTLCTILKFVTASAVEAELGAMFLNTKEEKSSDSHSKSLATHNRLPPFTAITQHQRA